MSEDEKKYTKLYNILYNKIVSGEWKAGQRIQPERDLCALYSVSRITVRETLRMLEQQGLISRTPGRGTFVQIRPVEQKMTKLYTLREQFEKQGTPHHTDILDFMDIKANLFIANELGLAIGDPVIKIVRLFFAAGTPYTLETTYLPQRYFGGITRQAVAENGLYNTFSTLGVTIQRAVERLKPVHLEKNASALFQAKTNDVAMKIERNSYFGDTIIEYTESIVRGDIFVYRVELS